MVLPTSPQQILAGVEAGTVVNIALVLIAFIWIGFKVYPDIKKTLDAIHIRRENEEQMHKSVEKLVVAVENIAAAQQEAFAEQQELRGEVNKIYKITKQQQEYIDESLEERAILMNSTKRLAQGMQELGANGVTRQTIADIDGYMAKKSHSPHSIHGAAAVMLEDE